MRYTISLLFLILAGMTNGHTEDSDPATPGIFKTPPGVKEYNRLVNSAELSICDSRYQDALETFDSAFLYLPDPFAIDKYNAFMCAILTRNYKMAEQYLKDIVAKGYDYTLLERNEAFLKISSRTRSKIMNEMKSVMPGYDLAVKNVYDSLLTVDQSLRKGRDYYNRYRDTLCIVDQVCGLRMISLIKQYGFPGESLAGVSKDLVSPVPWQIIVIHNHPNYCPERVLFDQEIRKAFEQGRLNCYNAARFFDETTGEDSYGIIASGKIQIRMEDTTIQVKDGGPSQYYFVRLSETTLHRYNENRAQLGMETVEESRRKITYSLHNTIFIFPSSVNSIFTFSSLAGYSDYKQNLVPVE